MNQFAQKHAWQGGYTKTTDAWRGGYTKATITRKISTLMLEVGGQDYFLDKDD